MAFRALALGLSVLLGPGIASVVAQAPAYSIHPDFTVKQWTAGDGLPATEVHDVLQDRDGYLWMATQGGLARFDGHTFTVYTTSTSPGLISNLLADLHEDADGNLWIQMGHGDVVRYRDGVFTPFDQTNGLPGRATGAFYTDADTLWVLTDWGLAHYHDGTMQPYRPDLVRDYVTALLRDRAGALWVSTYNEGLLRLTPDSVATPFTVEDGLPDAPIRTLFEDREGRLWVGTEQGVVYRRGDRFEPLLQGDQPWTRPVTTIYQDSTGTLWFGGEDWWSYRQGQVTPFVDGAPIGRTGEIKQGADGRLWRVRGSWLYGDDQPIYPTMRDRGFTFDREGNLWLGTDEGLFQIRRRAVYVFSEAEGLPGRNVYPILEDRDGALWFGTWGRGLARLDGTALTTYNLDTGSGAGPHPNNHVLSLYQDRQGTLWVGRGGALCRMQGDRCVPADIPLDPVLLEDIRALHEDRQGRSWLGTGYSGLLMGQPAGDGYAWTHYSTDNGLTSNRIRVIVETRNGDLLIGTNGGGLLRVPPPEAPTAPPPAGRTAAGIFEPFNAAGGPAIENVQDVYEDRDGLLWIATEGQGLCRLDRRGQPIFDRARVVCLDTEDGLFDNTIHRILEDDAGRLWMGTNRGIFWVERAELNAFADNTVGAVTPYGYTEADGMRTNKTNGGMQPAGIKARDGRLWFPTEDGAVVIDPARVPAPPAPPVLIETVRVGNRAHRPAGPLVLAPGERDLDIAYTAPLFTRPEDVRFRIRLDGYDDAWREMHAQRHATYDDLRPGAYTLHVKAGLGGSWTEEGATLTIERRPHVWETTWFLALCALLGGLGIFGLYRYRLRQVESRNLNLEQKVTERTAQLRRNQAQLEQQAEQLRQTSELKSYFLANVSHEFRTPLTLTIGPIEDLLNERYGPLPDDVRAQIGMAHRNAQRLLRLINQLLDLSKLEAGALVLHPRPYDLAAFLRRLTGAFDSLARTRRVTLRCDAPDDPFLHTFDADQLEKVVLNLLSNAFKFTPEAGSIRVGLRRGPGAAAVLTVTDTGAGIPAEHLPYLFDRFYQVDSATTRKHEGTGIGLALIHELVDLHGGTIEVESEVGRGTTFTVTLPDIPVPKDEDAAEPESDAALDERLNGVRLSKAMADLETAEPLPAAPPSLPAEEALVVLVVEDMADMRAYLRMHLEDAYLVEEAENGAVGLERALELVPDLVVSDVMMPELDGFGLCQALKTDERTSHIPVVLLTARADIQSRIVGFETGADAYLAKPFNADELRVRVRMLIEQRRKLRERYSRERGVSPFPDVALPALDAAFLEQVYETVATRLDDPDFGVDALAEAAGMSRRQLLRKLKALTDEKPNALIRRMRLERAAEMLRQHAGSVKEIAYAVGFRSTTHFSKIFHDTYDTSPAAYADQQAL